MRRLALAFGFLTRLPVPQSRAFDAEELARSAVWFPLVGLVVGGLVLAGWSLGASQPWLAALLGVLVWVLVTGGLHLDGAADLADALGAAHRDPARFQAVLKDAHIGSFGVIALVLILLTKWVGLGLIDARQAAILVLAPAWARLGALVWSHWLPPLNRGLGERFSWQVAPAALLAWALALSLLSLLLATTGFWLAAVVGILAWGAYLRGRLGGMNGDCLGAGVEYLECGLLLAAVI